VILSLPCFGRSWLLENSNSLERTRLTPIFSQFPNEGLWLPSDTASGVTGSQGHERC